jgi:hypothetical protein
LKLETFGLSRFRVVGDGEAEGGEGGDTHARLRSKTQQAQRADVEWFHRAR